MQNIGEKLEDARKRQGISVREASEATKIRADFLIDFENNRFDQDLPDIYKRGFVKIYARFLALDADKMVADYTAAQLGVQPSSVRRERSELGEVEVDTGYQSHYVSEEHPEEPAASGVDLSLYLKGGIIFVLIAVLSALVWLFISVLTQTTASSLVQESTYTEVVSSTSQAPVSTAPSSTSQGRDEIILVALGECTVMVRDAGNRAIIYRGTHTAGDRIPVEISGRVEIVATEVQNIQVERNGRTKRGVGTGMGKFFIE